MEGRMNHPCVVWGTCFLWIASIFAITWSLILFFSIGDMLMITGMDVVIALILLSGIIMFPTNVFMLYTIGNGLKLNYKSRVLCCPLWVLMMWIIIINCIGVFLCIERVCVCNTLEFIVHGMKSYRTVPRYKRFMDNLQWSLKCCGLDSYKDWFSYEWYEKIRDYEWDPSQKKFNRNQKKDMSVSDSVPLSCCKSGTCVPNYLMELGTNSIYTKGCNKSLYRVYMTSMNFHFIIFFTVVIAEVIILSCIMAKTSNGCDESQPHKKRTDLYNVKHLMPVNNKFLQSSSSGSLYPEDDHVESELTN